MVASVLFDIGQFLSREKLDSFLVVIVARM